MWRRRFGKHRILGRERRHAAQPWRGHRRESRPGWPPLPWSRAADEHFGVGWKTAIVRAAIDDVDGRLLTANPDAMSPPRMPARTNPFGRMAPPPIARELPPVGVPPSLSGGDSYHFAYIFIITFLCDRSSQREEGKGTRRVIGLPSRSGDEPPRHSQSPRVANEVDIRRQLALFARFYRPYPPAGV